jgi:hypothetical protein
VIRTWLLWYERYGFYKTMFLIIKYRIEYLKEWICGKMGHGETLWTTDEYGEELDYICDRCGKVLMC